jgi:RNA polymerase sigma-70 factor (ECF subfamily)
VSDDLRLLEAWRAGDRAAARTLLDRYFPVLYRFFRNKVDGDIDDLVQATFMAATKASGEVHSSFRAWLLTIARHELYRHLRGLKRTRSEVEFDPAAHTVIDAGTSPSSAVAREERKRVLLEALRYLPAELQLILELHYWEDLSTREIAAIADIPQGTVKSRLRRARESLEASIRTLEHDPERLQTTLANLDAWARDLREARAEA